MKIRLTKPHVIADTLLPADTILGDGGFPIPVGYQFTPYMEGLDEEGAAAVAKAVVRAYGRYPRYGPHVLIDDPPIPRTLEENQPVPHWPGSKDGKPYG